MPTSELPTVGNVRVGISEIHHCLYCLEQEGYLCLYIWYGFEAKKTGWMYHICSDMFSDEFCDPLNLVINLVANKSKSTSLRTNPNFVSSSHVCNLVTTAFDLTHACLQIPGVVSSTLSLSFSLQPDVHVFTLLNAGWMFWALPCS